MRRIRKILFPTRSTGLAYASLEQLLPLAGAGLEEVVFLHVIDRDEVGFVPYGGFDKELAREHREKAHLQFADWGALLSAKGLRWKEVLEIGDPEPKILEVAGREAVDLIAAGRRRHAADLIYPWGIAMDLLRDSGVPVLLLPEAGEGAPAPEKGLFGHVLFATDFSPRSASAFRFLAEIAGVAGRVSFLHVIGEREIDEVSEEEARRIEAERRASLEAAVAEARARGIAAEAHLLSGDPADEILGFARDRRCSVIVAGTGGKRGIGELLFGSVSHRVAESAPVPVVLVPLVA